MQIRDLIEKSLIVPISIPIESGEIRVRELYGSPQFITWLSERAAAEEPSPLGADLKPAEQLDSLFYSYVTGKSLIYDKQLKLIKAERHGVWEMKMPDLRIFGWFLAKNNYVAVFGDWTDRIKDFGLYRGYSIGVRRFRREIAAEDLCVRGVTPDDVI